MLALLSTEAELALPVPSARVQYWAYARSEVFARLARNAKTAVDADVPQRQTANAQRLGDALGTLLKGVLDELKLTEDQQATAPSSSASILNSSLRTKACKSRRCNCDTH